MEKDFERNQELCSSQANSLAPPCNAPSQTNAKPSSRADLRMAATLRAPRTDPRIAPQPPASRTTRLRLRPARARTPADGPRCRSVSYTCTRKRPQTPTHSRRGCTPCPSPRPPTTASNSAGSRWPWAATASQSTAGRRSWGSGAAGSAQPHRWRCRAGRSGPGSAGPPPRASTCSADRTRRCRQTGHAALGVVEGGSGLRRGLGMREACGGVWRLGNGIGMGLAPGRRRRSLMTLIPLARSRLVLGSPPASAGVAQHPLPLGHRPTTELHSRIEGWESCDAS